MTTIKNGTCEHCGRAAELTVRSVGGFFSLALCRLCASDLETAEAEADDREDEDGDV